MTIPFAQVDLRFGLVRARDFTNVGLFQPWPGPFQSAHVEFVPPFPDDDVRVFLTASNEDLGPNDHHAAIVAVADSIKKDGFDVFARSTDCALGSSSCNWLAVWGKPLTDTEPSIRVELRMARVQPLSTLPSFTILSPDCTPADTASWPTIPYSRHILDGQGNPLDPTVLLGQSNMVLLNYNIDGNFTPYSACVGMYRGGNAKGFELTARNFDVRSGYPMYHYLALARSEQPPITSKLSDLRIAMGEISLNLSEGGWWPSCWADRPIYFDSPFMTPPIILLTARTAPGMGVNDLRAFHAISHNPDPWGFTMMVRSADPQPGSMSVNWLALGCGEACGG